MASVYRDSLLKIAATASPDGGKGCLFERPPDGSIQVHYNETTLKETDAGCPLSNQLTRLSLLARPDNFYDRSATFYACPGVTYLIDPLRKSPLNRRGWVVQERLLARRIIHFAEDQLFWEFQTQFLSEGGTYNRVMAEGVYDRLTRSRMLRSRTSSPTSSFYVERISHRTLVKPGDAIFSKAIDSRNGRFSCPGRYC